MKHLKKLSVVLMLTTLFSVTFTSCIDNEVSPVVEAIYEAQADLIAAQAGVQNAEAALLLAKANAEQAIADATAATSASNSAASAEALRMAIATNDQAIATAQIALDKAELEWEIKMEEYLADLREAGAVEAAGYLTKYMGYMDDVNEGTSNLLDKQGDLAEAELLLKTYTTGFWWWSQQHTVTYEYYIAMLNSQLADLQANVAGANAKIAGYEAAMANPNAVDTQIAGIEDQIAAHEARLQELIVEIANAEQAERLAEDAVQAAMDVVGINSDYLKALGSTTPKDGLLGWKEEYKQDSISLKGVNTTIATLTPQVADYAGTLAGLRTAAAAATTRIGAKAVFYTSGDLKTAGFGLLGTKETLENKVYGTNGQNTLDDYTTATKYYGLSGTATVNTEFYYAGTVKTLSAEAVLWNANRAKYLYQQEFNALTTSYNIAANNLAAAQVGFDNQDFDAALTTATTNLTTAQGNLTTDIAAYNAAKTIFEAAPAGSSDVDTDATNYDGSILGNSVDGDNTTGAITGRTWRRVKTWKDDGTLSNNYVPDTFYDEAYDGGTAFTTVKANLVASTALTGVTSTNSVDGIYSIDALTDIYEFNADGTPGNTTFNGLTSAEVKLAIGFASTTDTDADINTAYFVNVESDDSSISNAFKFNLAANKLGTKSNAAFYTGTTTRNYGDVSYSTVSYDLDYTGSGTATDLTTYAKLWNAEKAFSEATYNLTGSTFAITLEEAQEEYDFQKELFEDGLANLDALNADVTAAAAIVGKYANPGRTGLLGDIALIDLELGTTTFADGTFVDAGLNTDGTTKETTGTRFFGTNTYKPFTLNENNESTSLKYDEDAVWTTTALTAYASLWNARNATFDFEATSLSSLQGLLTAAQADKVKYTNEMAEDLVFIAYYQDIVDELEAGYEALLATPEFAALNVAKLAAQAATQALKDEDTAIDSLVDDLETLISDLEDATTDYASEISDLEDDIAEWNQDIAELEVTIANANLDVAYNMNVTIKALEADIVKLQAEIAANQALAAKYKALMDAALAS